MNSALPEHIQQQLASDHFSGQLKGITPEALIADREHLLQCAKSFSVAPISGFFVGAIAVGGSGHLYLGANMEFPSVPLSSSLHAEQSAVLNAWLHGERKLQSLHVSELPCGHCRQFLFELSEASALKIHVGQTVTSLESLLPSAFSGNRSNGKGLLDSARYHLDPIRPHTSDLIVRAINAAELSYTPYTENPTGCILESTSGHFFSGRSAESVAFNPSVPSIICALNQRNLSAHRKELIQSCTLAKLATGIHSQYDLVVSLLKGICKTEIRTVLVEGR